MCLLAHHISTTVAAGSFATAGTIDNFVLPGISVNPVGQVRLPLSTTDARLLIRASCQAPFGKGGQTVIDKEVRNTWEVDGDAVHFLNPNWQYCLDAIVAKAAGELGALREGHTIRADLYKMLLYDEGAMFREHQESVCALFTYSTC